MEKHTKNIPRFFNTDLPAGNYTLTAKATNSNNGVTTSAARTITIEGTVVSGNVYYIHSDHLETPREITNEQNQTVWKNPPLTEPFGSTPVDDDPDGDGQTFTFNLRFPGQYYDQETGTHYNYYRDNYLPDFGRYGQSDPIGLRGGINTYAYVRGNPLIYVDPDGRYAPTVPIGQLIAKAIAEALAAAGTGTAAGAAMVAGAGIGAYYLTDQYLNPWLQPMISDLLWGDGEGSSGAGSGAGEDAGAGTGSGSRCPKDDKQKRCEKEWEDAYRQCKQWLSQNNPPRGLTGGHTNLSDCARGLVSEDCGGNPVQWGRGRR